LLNLISNAIKYNSDDGTVTISSEEVDGSRLKVRVRDTGPGIKPDSQSKLFTPFEHLGAEQTGVMGTGLGLDLSKRLLEMTGGSIGVENNPDRGATFWMELPLVQDPVTQLQTAMPVAATPVGPVRQQRQRIVLYVEDNRSNITLIEHIIVHRPHVKLVAAKQGRLGLDISGEDVLHGLRQELALQNTPVIVISADATRRRIERLQSMGVLDYLPKPLDIKRFLQLLDTCLSGRDSPK
jgi:hypothetical protein